MLCVLARGKQLIPPKDDEMDNPPELRECEEDVEVDGLFEELSTGGTVPVKALQKIALQCTPEMPLSWPEEASTPRTAEDGCLTKRDLRTVLLGAADARRQSNAKWISYQKNMKIAKDPDVVYPGSNEEERNKSGQKVLKHLRVDELNLGELDDDAEFERIKQSLIVGSVGNAKLSKTTIVSEEGSSGSGQNERDETLKERLVMQRNSFSLIHPTESEQHLNRLFNQLQSIPVRKKVDTSNSDSPRRIKHKVNAAILSELFTKHHPKHHTVDDVLKAIDREEGFAHGWEDQRRKPGTTVMFVGQARLARKAQHGFMLPEINKRAEVVSSSPSHVEVCKPTVHQRSQQQQQQQHSLLPEWKQAWKLLSKNQQNHGVNKQYKLESTRKYKNMQGSGLHGLTQEKPYHLTPLQRAECLERAHTSMEETPRRNVLLENVASKALAALTSWKSSTPSPSHSTAYARSHFPNYQTGM